MTVPHVISFVTVSLPSLTAPSKTVFEHPNTHARRPCRTFFTMTARSRPTTITIGNVEYILHTTLPRALYTKLVVTNAFKHFDVVQLQVSDRVVADITDSAKLPLHRVTLTLPILDAASQIIFVCTGGFKAPVILILEARITFFIKIAQRFEWPSQTCGHESGICGANDVSKRRSE